MGPEKKKKREFFLFRWSWGKGETNIKDAAWPPELKRGRGKRG